MNNGGPAAIRTRVTGSANQCDIQATLWGLILPNYARDISATGFALEINARFHGCMLIGSCMAVNLQRRVDYPMLDSANIAYFPRIYDLAHRFFEECWELMCEVSYPEMINQRRVGFPIVHIDTDFISPLRYGDTVHAKIWIEKIGTKSCTWAYRFYNQNQDLVWSSSQVTVCVNMDNLESIIIPDWLRNGLEKHLEQGE